MVQFREAQQGTKQPIEAGSEEEVIEALVEHLLAKKGKGAIRALEQTEGQLHRTGAYLPSRRG